jgi:hypothetical protein
MTNLRYLLSLVVVIQQDTLLKRTLPCKPLNKGNNKITELRTILQRESQNS